MRAVALAAAFVAVQFYTSLASLSPTPPVGYLFVSRAGALAIVALLIAGAIAGATAVRGFASLRSPILVPWIGALALASVAGFDPRSGLQVTGIAMMTGLMHAGIVACAPSARVRATILNAYLLAGAIACAAAIVFVELRVPTELFVANNGRAAGFFVTANQCAAFTVLYAAIAAGSLLVLRGAWRIVAGFGFACAIVTLGLSFSLGGWLGFCAAALFLSFSLNRRAGFWVAGALAIAGILALPQALQHHNAGDSITRLGAWTAGWRVFTLFPLTGAGPMAYWEIYPWVAPAGADPPGKFGALHPHDVPLSLLGELGLLGTALVVAGFVAYVRAIRTALRAALPPARTLGLAVCAALIACGVQGLVDLVGVVQLAFVWIPYTALGLMAAREGPA